MLASPILGAAADLTENVAVVGQLTSNYAASRWLLASAYAAHATHAISLAMRLIVVALLLLAKAVVPSLAPGVASAALRDIHTESATFDANVGAARKAVRAEQM